MRYIIEKLNQGSVEWLEWRRTKVTATDASCIMGVNPWCTEYNRWQEKLGLIAGPEMNRSMQRGIEMEEFARHRFMELTGISVFPQVITSIEYPWMAASLDGLSLCGKYIVEVKCPGKADQESAQCGIVPEKYHPQLQHQLAVTGLDMAYYYSFDGEDGILLEVPRDQKYIDEMIIKEKKFYDCLVQFKAPELTDKDYTERNDNEWKEAAHLWKAKRFHLKNAEQEEKQARDHLLSLCVSKNSLGEGVKAQKIIKTGFVNYSEIPELQNVDLEKYRKPSSEYWKICEI